MLPGNGGVDGEKIVDGFARLEKVDERLHGYSSICEAWGTVQDLFIDGHYACQRASLLRDRHRFYDKRNCRQLVNRREELLSPYSNPPRG